MNNVFCVSAHLIFINILVMMVWKLLINKLLVNFYVVSLKILSRQGHRAVVFSFLVCQLTWGFLCFSGNTGPVIPGSVNVEIFVEEAL